jgi:hypothetical protein
MSMRDPDWACFVFDRQNAHGVIVDLASWEAKIRILVAVKAH